MLLSTAYFPPLSWFALVASGFTLSPDRVFPSVVSLEACEHYQKQSWRNRCRFYAAGGPEILNVPVVHSDDLYHTPIKNIKVDYSAQWLIRHQRAIDSAYRTSSYFEYYRDDLYALMNEKPQTLWDLNLSIIHYMLDAFGIAAEIVPTSSYLSEAQDDYRHLIHPKRADDVLASLQLEKPYFQVFSQKYGFVPNLSAIDLLFNEGPDSISWLKSV